jgi:SAM-dependent methyltransferase
MNNNLRHVLSAARHPLRTIRRTHQKISRANEMRSAQADLLGRPSLDAYEKEMLRAVSLKVSPADDMFEPGGADHYLSVGLSALRCINRVLAHHNQTPGRVLDLPSGGGRVLRYLQAAFPNAEFVACDTSTELLQFCESKLHVTSQQSTASIDQLQLPSRFGLIWCGSLLTHLDEQRCLDLLRFFYNHLIPNGVCVLSSHGQTAIDRLRHNEFTYGLPVEARQSLLSQVKRDGFGYADYDGGAGYGVSIIERDRMIDLAEQVGDWSLSCFLESGWDNFHDIYAFTKRKNIAPLIERIDAEFYRRRQLLVRQRQWCSST